MSKTLFYHVDAFTRERFKGNPATVCLMPCNLQNSLYLSIAREINLSETAFLEKTDDAYKLRWFTPIVEVPLCGHATLAAAHVLFDYLGYRGDKIVFNTLSGQLTAVKVSDGIQMDFPQNKSYPVDPPHEALKALGIKKWRRVYYNDTNKKLLIHIEDAETLKALTPDFEAFLRSPNPYGWEGAVVTAEASGEYDFTSRYFAPHRGIAEDPVTGSSHTVLGPYWAELLGKQKMRAYQASARGGELTVELSGDRVLITGNCVTVLVGILNY